MTRERNASSRLRHERIFFCAMAVAFAVSVFVGFAGTYFLRSASDLPPDMLPMTPLLHAHGAIFSGWIVLLLVQSFLVAGGRTDVHRQLGVAGAAWAGLMVVVGILVAVAGAARGSSPPGTDPHQFMAVPFFDILVFAVLVGLAIRARRRPDTHKRLLIVATAGVTAAAVARWPFELMATGGPIAFFGMADMFVVPLVVFDLVTLRRLHPATLWGGLLLVLSQPLRLLLSTTDAWMAFARWMTG